MKYGVDDNGIFKRSIEDINKQLDTMKSQGVEWLRVGFYWEEIESSQRQFRFETDRIHYDVVVAEASKRGIKILGLLSGVSRAYPSLLGSFVKNGTQFESFVCPGEWSNEQHELWKNFIKATVGRYKDTINHWEIWNEPNLNDFWHGVYDLDKTDDSKIAKQRFGYGFVRLLKDARVAIGSCYHSKADYKIISGGINRVRCKYEHFPFHWLCTSKEYIDYFCEALTRLDAWDSFDYFGIHPYRSSSGPQAGPDQENSKWSKFNPYMGTIEKELRMLVKKYIRGHSIWVTEIGWGEQGDSIGQGFNLLNTYNICKYVGSLIDCVVWYNWMDVREEDNMGLVDTNGNMKPICGLYRAVQGKL